MTGQDFEAIAGLFIVGLTAFVFVIDVLARHAVERAFARRRAVPRTEAIIETNIVTAS
jgi:hypothetical protein